MYFVFCVAVALHACRALLFEWLDCVITCRSCCAGPKLFAHSVWLFVGFTTVLDVFRAVVAIESPIYESENDDLLDNDSLQE
jgi:hypothetical protein